jgi:hypothetical protein
MRRSFTLLFLLLLIYPLQAQNARNLPAAGPVYQKFAIRDTIGMQDVPRDELYSRAWRWFAEVSKKVPSLLEEANKRYGRFTGTSSFSFSSGQNGGSEHVKGRIYYNFTVYVEDDFYVYELTDFTHVARLPFNTITTHEKYPYRVVANEEWHTLVWQEMKDKINKELQPMVESLKADMLIETERFEEYKAISERSPANGE